MRFWCLALKDVVYTLDQSSSRHSATTKRPSSRDVTLSSKGPHCETTITKSITNTLNLHLIQPSPTKPINISFDWKHRLRWNPFDGKVLNSLQSFWCCLWGRGSCCSVVRGAAVWLYGFYCFFLCVGECVWVCEWAFVRRFICLGEIVLFKFVMLFFQAFWIWGYMHSY